MISRDSSATQKYLKALKTQAVNAIPAFLPIPYTTY